jgi:hypothetical protein
MDTSKSVSELIDIESADFASRVCDVVMDGDAFSQSTMFVIIDELLQDMMSQAQDTTDQVKMLSVVHNASKALREALLDEEGEG